MAEIKWIKISTDIFDDEKISIIEDLPDSDTIIVIWFKLLVLAGKRNDGGIVYITRDIPYDPEKLARVMRRNVNTVKLALHTFQEFGMITLEEDYIYIENWEKHQNVEGMEKIREKNRIRQQKYREKQRQIEENNVISRDSNGTDKTRLDKNNIEQKESKEHPLPATITSKRDAGIWQKAMKNRNTNNFPAEFDQMWRAYPRKRDKKAACLKWLECIENGASVDELYKAVKNYAREAEGKEETYIKHGKTFFGASEPWRDYTYEPKQEREPKYAKKMFGEITKKKY